MNMQEKGLSCISNHAKQINIKQSKSYLAYVRVNHVKVSKTIKWSSKAIKHGKIANQTSKQIESPCLKKEVPTNRPIKRHIFLTSVQAWSSKSPVESPICGPAFFTCAPTRSARLAFYLWKNWFLKKSWSRHLFYFYFEGKIKQERKTLKSDSIVLEKACLWETRV